ncbi:MAG: PKD domain-containing protein [Pseudomonadales bacterium]
MRRKKAVKSITCEELEPRILFSAGGLDAGASLAAPEGANSIELVLREDELAGLGLAQDRLGRANEQPGKTSSTFQIEGLGIEPIKRANDSGFADTINPQVALYGSVFNSAQAASFIARPVFQSSGPFSVDEGAIATTVVGDVDAHDGDGGVVDSGINYSITANTNLDGDANNAFSINSSSGVITVNDADDLDFESASALTIAVQADDGTETRSTDITINLNDVTPTLTAAGTGAINAGVSYTLDLIADEPGTNSITSYTVNWGDGNVTTETYAGPTTSVSHIYANVGYTYDVTFAANEASGSVTESDLIVPSFNAGSDDLFVFDGTSGNPEGLFDSTISVLDQPYGLAVGPDGNFYVAGYESDNIVRFAANGNYLGVFSSDSRLDFPTSVAWGGDGNLYVSNYDGNNILRFLPDGTFDRVFSSGGELNGPEDLVFGPDGDLYVSSWQNSKIVVIDGDNGGAATQVLDGGDGLSNPEQIAFGENGDLFIANGAEGEVLRWDGSDVTSYFTHAQLEHATGVAFGPDGNLYVSSFDNDTILRYDGSSGEVFVDDGVGGLEGPAYLAFTPNHLVTIVNNNAPTATNLNTTTSYIEGDVSVAVADIVVSDDDALDIVTATLTLANTATGSLDANDGASYNPSTGVWTISGTVATVNTALAGVLFNPATNNDLDTTINVIVDDGNEDGGVALTGSIALTVTPVNDAPTATNISAGESYTEDTSLNLTDIVVSDIDTATTTVTLTLSDIGAGSLSTSTSGIVSSTYSLATGVWSASGAIADVNTLLAGVTFDPSLNYNSNFSISTSVSDGVAPSVLGTKSVTASATNDAPIASNLDAAETFIEDTPLNLTNIVVSDVDHANTTVRLTLSDAGAGSLSTATSGGVISSYNAGTGEWSATGAIADVNTLLAGINFNPTFNYDSNFTIATSVSDGVAAPVTGTKSVTAIPVSDVFYLDDITGQSDKPVGALTTTEPTDVSLEDYDGNNGEEGLQVDKGGLNENESDSTKFQSWLIDANNLRLHGSVTLNVWSGVKDFETDKGGKVEVFLVDSDSGGNDLTVISSYFIQRVDWDPTNSGTWVEDVFEFGNIDYTFAPGRFLGLKLIVHPDSESDMWFAYDTTTYSSRLTVDQTVPTLVVNTALDENDGTVSSIAGLIANPGGTGISLREAILATNATANGVRPDQIHFDLSGSNTIVLSSALPSITEAVDIDGRTDADYAGTPVVELDGSGTSSSSGLALASNGSTIRGLVINRFDAYGVLITGNGNTIESSYIGTNVSGDAGLGNGQNGIRIADASGNTIGGEGVGNLISGNTWSGIRIRDAGSQNNVIAGNRIGTNANADAAITNGNYGVEISVNGPSNNTIGGTNSSLGNIISGNSWAGVRVGSGAFNNTILGNKIGTGVDTSVQIGNSLSLGSTANGGVQIDDGASNNTIGGTVAGAANTIAFNPGSGVKIFGVSSVGNSIQRNEIYDNDVRGIELEFPTNSNAIAPILSLSEVDGSSTLSVSGTYSDVSLAGQAITLEYFSNPIAGNEGRTYLDSDTITLDGSGNQTIASNFVANVTPGEFVTVTATDSAGNTSEFSNSQQIVLTNDAPTATNLSAAEGYIEDVPLKLADIFVSDVDHSTTTVTLTISDVAAGSLSTATAGTVTSTYDDGTGVWLASGSIADVNTLLSGLTFNPALNYNSNFSIATSVTDGLTAPLTGTKNVTATATNDAPTVSNLDAAERYTEDSALNLVDIVASDVDHITTTVSLTISDLAAGSLSTGTSGAVTSTYNAGSGVWLASGAIADVNALLAGVTFNPSLNYDSNFSIASSVSDGVAPALTATKIVIATPINDAPAATNLSTAETYVEDIPLNLVDVVASDIDNATITASLTISDSAAGSLSTGTSGSVTSIYNASSGVWSASGSTTDVNALLASTTFNPTQNYNDNFSIATSVSDGLAPALTGTKNITATLSNDAPTATSLNAAENYTEDLALDLLDIVVSDVDHATTTVSLTLSNVNAGTLSTAISGAVVSTFNPGTGVWSASGDIGQVNTLLAGVTFTPTLDFNDNFTIETSVSDGVAPTITGTKSVSGTAVNDAPVAATNGPFVISEGTDLLLDGSASYDVDGTIDSYGWEVFGPEGTFETSLVSPTLSWENLSSIGIDDDGSYQVALSVTDDQGSVDVATFALTVNNTPPVVTVTGNSTVVLNTSYTLTLDANDPGAEEIASWTIDWGDGTIDTLLGNPSNANHVYTTPGQSYNVSVLVTDGDGSYMANDVQVTIVDNLAPTLTLSEISATLAENVDTTGRIKLADVSVQDDGVGSNALVLTGANAQLFEIDAGVLYLKAGVDLDFETLERLVVTLSVNDASIGSDPEDTADFELNISDVDETVETGEGDEEGVGVFLPSVTTESDRDFSVALEAAEDASAESESENDNKIESELPAGNSEAETFLERGLMPGGTRGTDASSGVNPNILFNGDFKDQLDQQVFAEQALNGQATQAANVVSAEQLALLDLLAEQVIDISVLHDSLNYDPMADFSALDNDSFVSGLDSVRSQLLSDADYDKVVIGSSMAASTSLSIGYVLWLMRGGILLSTIMSSLPAWRLIDPLPVLGSAWNEGEDDDDDSLQAIIESENESPAQTMEAVDETNEPHDT